MVRQSIVGMKKTQMIDYAEIDESKSYGKLLLGALLVSLLIHGFFLYAAWKITPSGFGEDYYQTIVPKKFRLEPVTVDPKSFDQEEEKKQEPVRPVPISLPDETVIPVTNQSQSVSIPTKLDPQKIEEPLVTTPSLFGQTIDTLPVSLSSNFTSELDAVRDQILESSATSPNRPILPLPEEGISNGVPDFSGMRVGKMADYSDIDKLLLETGPLEKGTPPLQLPSDFLFEYDDASLREGAIEGLRKLGTLIERNPKTKFRIEGHTDSFGTPEYNLLLSERRAEAVKAWLGFNMGINPSQVSTRGWGSSKLIAPASESIEGQKQNRRVEIILEVEN